MKKTLAFFTSFLIIAVCTVSAQSEEELLQQINAQGAASPIGVTLQQHGTGNEAYIRQVSQDDGGIIARQSGNENYIQLMETGDYIEIHITQEGSENYYEGDIDGSDSRINITQSGAENSIYQSLITNGTGISIMQRGHGNEVIHTGTSTNSGIQVQQQGAGMKIIIQTN